MRINENPLCFVDFHEEMLHGRRLVRSRGAAPAAPGVPSHAPTDPESSYTHTTTGESLNRVLRTDYVKFVD